MKRNVTLMAVAVLGGCFGNHGAVVPVVAPEKKEEIKAAPVMAQTPSSGPNESVAPSATPAPVVARDGAEIVNIKVGDPILESAVWFTASKAGAVEVSDKREGLQLFRFHTEELGQSRLIGAINGAVVSLPQAGDYLIAGPEKELAIESMPITLFSAMDRQTQLLECPEVERGTTIDFGITGYWWAIYAWTGDTSFPVKVDVYLHGGLGSDHKGAEYSFANWREYNRTRSPDKARLAQEVRDYIIDPWDTSKRSDEAVARYLRNRRGCGDPGRPWIDACHSAGCLKAEIAMPMNSFGPDSWNHLGIIEVTPARGGSHLAIKEIANEAFARTHTPKVMQALYAAIIRGWGGFIVDFKGTLAEIASRGTLDFMNEGVKATAWNGRGTGIPRRTYNRFSEFFFNIPYLTGVLKPENRFLTEGTNIKGSGSPEMYVGLDGKTRFNYAEGLDSFIQEARSTFNSLSTEKRADVLAGYMEEEVVEESKDVLQRFGVDEALTNIWLIKDIRLDEELQKRGLAWLNTIIATAAATVEGDINENAANDGMVTIAQQLNLSAGSSILAPTSRYGALKIDEDAIRKRLPAIVDQFTVMKNLSHAGAVLGEPRVWDWMNERIFARLSKLREEEQENYVLTREDAEKFRDMLFPEEPRFLWAGYYREQGAREFTFNTWNVTFRQDPLEVGHKTRVRISGPVTVSIRHFYWYERTNEWMLEVGRDETKTLDVEKDFILRNGIWHLVIN